MGIWDFQYYRRPTKKEFCVHHAYIDPKCRDKDWFGDGSDIMGFDTIKEGERTNVYEDNSEEWSILSLHVTTFYSTAGALLGLLAFILITGCCLRYFAGMRFSSARRTGCNICTLLCPGPNGDNRNTGVVRYQHNASTGETCKLCIHEPGRLANRQTEIA